MSSSVPPSSLLFISSLLQKTQIVLCFQTPEIIPTSQQSQHNLYFSHLVSPFRRKTTVGQHQGRYLGLSTKPTFFPARQDHRQCYAFKNMPELLSIITEQMAKSLVNTEQHLIAEQPDVCLIRNLPEKRKLAFFSITTRLSQQKERDN